MAPCTRCGQKPGHALLRWGAVLALGAAMEAEAVGGKRHGHTFSHATRSAFHTQTSGGRKCFTGAWLVLTVWFLDHILRHESNHRP